MNPLLYLVFAAMPAIATIPVVPDSPCTVSFNGFPLSSTVQLNPYDIHDVHHLLKSVAADLPEGFSLHRLSEAGGAPPERSDFIPASVTVTIPSSISDTNDFTAVGQVKLDEVWSAAQDDAPGVLHHLARSVEKTPLNFFAAYGRPVYVYISVPGFAIVPL